MTREITSADVAAFMTVDELFPAGFALEQFGADAGIVSDAVTELETRMTIDGKLVAGYTPQPKTVTITFEPTSPTLEYLREVANAQRTERRVYEINLSVRVRSTDRTFKFVRGFLTSSQPMPAVNKTLEAMPFQFTFEDVE